MCVPALPSSSPNSVQHKRVMIAEFCRLLGSSFSAPPPDPTAGLPPRHVQTLQRLLEGDSEKQIARHLGVSPHTVHVYVKALYRHFDVNSRGELLAPVLSARLSSECFPCNHLNRGVARRSAGCGWQTNNTAHGFERAAMPRPRVLHLAGVGSPASVTCSVSVTGVIWLASTVTGSLPAMVRWPGTTDRPTTRKCPALHAQT